MNETRRPFVYHKSFRHPRTMAELKAIAGTRADGKIGEFVVQFRLSRESIPTAWDDIPHSRPYIHIAKEKRLAARRRTRKLLEALI